MGIAGFLAPKKAAFSELKKQGLDLLETDAGNHLLGHLLLKQGGFTKHQQQRIRVLTDGSIDYRKVEVAIRKEAPTRSYWAEDWDDEESAATYFADWPLVKELPAEGEAAKQTSERKRQAVRRPGPRPCSSLNFRRQVPQVT